MTEAHSGGELPSVADAALKPLRLESIPLPLTEKKQSVMQA